MLLTILWLWQENIGRCLKPHRFAFDRVQPEKPRLCLCRYPVRRCLCRGRCGHGAAKHLVLLSLVTLNVATCMWTAAMSLLPRTLLRNVVGVCTLCVQMLFNGIFAVPFSVVWCVRTLVSSNCRTLVGCTCSRFGVCPVSALKSQFHDLF